MTTLHGVDFDFDRLRTAGKDMLSLALIDSRNRSLRWAAAIEDALGGEGLRELTPEAPRSEFDPPLWTLGHLGWFQEFWIARNVQRRRGERAEADATRLASVFVDADRWYEPRAWPKRQRWAAADALPDAATTRQYLFDALEATLDLLDAEPEESDDSLYFYRLAVLREDMQAEAFAVLAQSVGFAPGGEGDGGKSYAAAGSRPQASGQRSPLLMPATRWRLGFDGAGFAFDFERQAHVVAIPEFEIDAQPVTWSQYGEFVEDGGYDDAAHWSEAGWRWLAAQGRRSPRHVDQLRHGVLQRRFGQLCRVPGNEAVVHVSHHEAEAWCRWAGRRLPGEAEWEAAAHQGASRGFRFGSVREWTATTFGPWPGFKASGWRGALPLPFGSTRVLRGASSATPQRLRSARLRGFAVPDADAGFFGFRSCAFG